MIEARVEFEHEDTARGLLHDEVDRVLRALRDSGYEPVINVDAIEDVG